MADVLDVLHRMTYLAGDAADVLRTQIAEAQKVVDKLDAFASDAENTAQLAASSDLFPNYSALAPDGTGNISRRPGTTGGDVSEPH